MTKIQSYFDSLQFIPLQAGQWGEGLNTFSLWGGKGKGSKPGKHGQDIVELFLSI